MLQESALLLCVGTGGLASTQRCGLLCPRPPPPSEIIRGSVCVGALMLGGLFIRSSAGLKIIKAIIDLDGLFQNLFFHLTAELSVTVSTKVQSSQILSRAPHLYCLELVIFACLETIGHSLGLLLCGCYI